VATIKASREIDQVFRQAKRVAHPLLIVLTAPTPEGRGHEGRVAFVAGVRLGGAVLRNRSKRVLRHAVRRCGGPWPDWDVVVLARPTTAAANAADLDDALSALLRRSGVVR
jgi:ribonuclease P protein component